MRERLWWTSAAHLSKTSTGTQPSCQARLTPLQTPHCNRRARRVRVLSSALHQSRTMPVRSWIWFIFYLWCFSEPGIRDWFSLSGPWSRFPLSSPHGEVFWLPTAAWGILQQSLNCSAVPPVQSSAERGLARGCWWQRVSTAQLLQHRAQQQRGCPARQL